MHDAILVINAGSSSLKFSVYQAEADQTLAEQMHGQIENIGSDHAHFSVTGNSNESIADQKLADSSHHGAIAAIHDWFKDHVGSEASFAGAGHRVVHGGADFIKPVLINDDILAKLHELIPLAPLHQPHNIAAIEAIRAIAPELPQVACFDTSFHRSQPRLAQLFGLPREITNKGVLRYGFHGLSYEYIAGVLPDQIKHGRVVVAHLGNGASMCAMVDGKSVASTMGFTAVDGLVMGTRTGSLDPGVVLYLMQQEGMTALDIQDLIYKRSGLLGVSGISSDMRTLLADRTEPAREAVDLFIYHIVREFGSLAAAMGGVDGLVFTGGIGEHAAAVRDKVTAAIAWFGAKIFVIPTDEDLVIGRAVIRLLDTPILADRSRTVPNTTN